MSATFNIYFNSANDGGSVSSPESPGGTAMPENPEQNDAGEGTRSVMTTSKAVGMYVLKQALNYSTSHIGEWTRDSAKQKQVDSIMSIAGYAVGFATNPVMTGITLATNIITSMIDYNTKASQEANSLRMLNKRAGNVNRSRT